MYCENRLAVENDDDEEGGELIRGSQSEGETDDDLVLTVVPLGMTYRVEQDTKLEDGYTEDLGSDGLGLTSIGPPFIKSTVGIIDTLVGQFSRVFLLVSRVRHWISLLAAVRMGSRCDGSDSMSTSHDDTSLGEVGGTDSVGAELEDESEKERSETYSKLLSGFDQSESLTA